MLVLYSKYSKYTAVPSYTPLTQFGLVVDSDLTRVWTSRTARYFLLFGPGRARREEQPIGGLGFGVRAFVRSVSHAKVLVASLFCVYFFFDSLCPTLPTPMWHPTPEGHKRYYITTEARDREDKARHGNNERGVIRLRRCGSGTLPRRFISSPKQ